VGTGTGYPGILRLSANVRWEKADPLGLIAGLPYGSRPRLLETLTVQVKDLDQRSGSCTCVMERAGRTAAP
jgi:hypothetical protein